MTEREVLALLPGPAEDEIEIDCTDTIRMQEIVVARFHGLVAGLFSTEALYAGPGKMQAGPTFRGRLTDEGAARRAKLEHEATR